MIGGNGNHFRLFWRFIDLNQIKKARLESENYEEPTFANRQAGELQRIQEVNLFDRDDNIKYLISNIECCIIICHFPSRVNTI